MSNKTRLDVLLVEKVSLLRVPAIIGKYKNGRWRELPEIIRHFRTDRVRILCDGPTPVNLDGELRVAQAVTMEVAREKVNFFYPKNLAWTAKSEIL